jgi:hypothetical protein
LRGFAVKISQQNQFHDVQALPKGIWDRLCSNSTTKIQPLTVLDPTFDIILDRFITEERLPEIKSVRPSERSDDIGELSYSTASGYLSNIKRIREKWGTMNFLLGDIGSLSERPKNRKLLILWLRG